jgi:hypothetical protein
MIRRVSIERKLPVASCQLPEKIGLATGNWQLATTARVTDGIRTRDIEDHNLALYQLSYSHRVD